MKLTVACGARSLSARRWANAIEHWEEAATMTRFFLVTVSTALVGAAAGTACSEPASCGGDICLVYTTVAGHVTTPGGEPLGGLRLESQSASYQPGCGCDTTFMMTWYDAETTTTGDYVLTLPNGSVDEVSEPLRA
jgi:hypothetical protein